MEESKTTPNISKCEQILNEKWVEVLEKDPETNLEESLCDTIRRCINNKLRSYRYVLPTQLVAKLADHSLDSRCIQASRGKKGDFDARSVNKKVIVKFDKENNNVLGGSPEPYVNNPLRIPEISEAYRDNQKNKEGWDDLSSVLNQIESRNDPKFTESIFEQVLLEIKKILPKATTLYPTEEKTSLSESEGTSLQKTLELVSEFLRFQSGGDHLLAVTAAFFETLSSKFNQYKTINREKINASDTSSGQIADVECYNSNNELILGIEVKDMKLTVFHLQEKLASISSSNVPEFLFVTNGGIEDNDRSKINKIILEQQKRGHHIQVVSIMDFLQNTLPLFGGDGRFEFLTRIGNQLNKFDSDISSREKWAELLAKIIE